MQAGRTLYGRVVRTPAGFFEAVDAARAAPARHVGLLDTMELCEALGRLEVSLGAERGSCCSLLSTAWLVGASPVISLRP